MEQKTLSLRPIPFSLTVLEGPSANIPRSYRNDRPDRYLDLAVSTLAEYDIAVPEHHFVETIVRAALAAQHLFFSAALHEPTGNELDLFFEGFVLHCIQESIQINECYRSRSGVADLATWVGRKAFRSNGLPSERSMHEIGTPPNG
jgi:hypothetical protein